MEISVYRLAKALKVSRPRLNEIVLGTKAVTTDTALHLGRYFGTTPEFWLALQTRYDLDTAAPTLRPAIEREVQPHAAFICFCAPACSTLSYRFSRIL